MDAEPLKVECVAQIEIEYGGPLVVRLRITQDQVKTDRVAALAVNLLEDPEVEVCIEPFIPADADTPWPAHDPWGEYADIDNQF